MVQSALLHYQELGKGPPVVFIHGLFGSLINWSSVVKSLKDSYRCICVDVRNHGESFWSHGMSYQDCAQDLKKLFDALGLSQVHLVGHSMGGKIAMMFALLYPKYVKKMVIVDVAPIYYECSFVRLISHMKSLDLSLVKSHKEAGQMLEEKIPDKSLRLFLLKNLTRVDRGFAWKLNLEALSCGMQDIQSWDDMDARYEPKALFISGQYSVFLTPHMYPHVFKYFPQAHITQIKRAGHNVHIDQKDVFVEKLQEFIQDEL